MFVRETSWGPWPQRSRSGDTPASTVPAVLLAVAIYLKLVLRTIRLEALKQGSYLVPVRIFIGVGWLRAFAEKAVEPGWRDGSSLSTFLVHQLHAPAGVFPPYQALINDLFLPHATPLGWVIMAGQLLAGFAILSGSLTTAALLGGLFMNLNFLLAGVPDPSAFYIVLQMVLLMAGAGAIFGIDARLGAQSRIPALLAQPGNSLARPLVLGAKSITLMTLSLASAVYATLQIKDWTPGGSVHDPAAVLAVLSFMMASWIAIVAMHGNKRLSQCEAIGERQDAVQS